MTSPDPMGTGSQEVVVNFMQTELATITYGAEVSFDQFDLGAGWNRGASGIRAAGLEPATAVWYGRAGKTALLSLQTGPEAGKVVIVWNGYEHPVNLHAAVAGRIMVTLEMPGTTADRWVGGLSLWSLFTFLFYGLLQIYAAFPVGQTHKANQRSWLVYAIPPLVIWMFYLLAFWPGLLSQDSIDQWGQIMRAQIESWHSPFHTLMIWLITLVWSHPAAVLLVQIVALALAAAWGLGALEKRGLPKWAAWVISLVFAFSPVNGVMVTTLWKDIPYSIALLVLSIQVMKIVLSGGAWLERRGHWLGLGLSCAMVGLFRHNGAAVALVILVCLLWVYRQSWRRIVIAAVITLGSIILVLGPLYTLVGVDRQKGYSNVAFLYQIGAHYAYGTPFTSEEMDYMQRLLPAAEWAQSYDPCTVNPILFHEQFNTRNFLYEDMQTPRLLFLRLFLRNPAVNLQHMLTSGSLVWEINPSCYLYYSPLDYYETDRPPFSQVKWVMRNPFGFEEDSKIPFLAAGIFRLFYESKQNWLLWRPAVALFWVVLVSFGLFLRFGTWRVLLIALPVVVQSGILMAVNIAQDFRYQFGVVLVSILFTGLLLIQDLRTGEKE